MILDRILGFARQHPDKPAVIADGTVWTYAAFAAAIIACRERLAGRFTGPGVVVVACERLADDWITGIALRSLGLTTINVVRGLEPAAISLRNVVGIAGAASRQGDIEVWVAAHPVGVELLEPAVPAAAALVPVLSDLPPTGGQILLTAETTGTPKKILREPRTEAASLDAHAALYGIGADASLGVGDFSASNAGGWRWPQLGWSQGATVIFEQRPGSARLLREQAPTHAFATPRMLGEYAMLSAEELPRQPDLRLFVTGGPLPGVFAARVLERLTPNLVGVFATAETSIIAMTPVRTVEDIHWLRPLPGMEIEVIDPEGKVEPVDTPGLLRVRPLAGVDGYLDDPETSALFFRDGWFYPGDLAVIAADGRIALQGRGTDVISLLGTRVAPGPVEELLRETLKASAVCLFSVLGQDNQDILHVVVESKTEPHKGVIEEAVGRTIGVFAAIGVHRFDPLPRDATGAVMRPAVKRAVMQRGER